MKTISCPDCHKNYDLCRCRRDTRWQCLLEMIGGTLEHLSRDLTNRGELPPDRASISRWLRGKITPSGYNQRRILRLAKKRGILI